jgi:DNA-binding GntR family transcriptional regulator
MLNMLDPNKSFVSVLLNTKGKAEEKPEMESVNPDQGMIEAAKELVKAVEKKDAERIVRVFKAMMKMCYDEMDDESEDSEME